MDDFTRSHPVSRNAVMWMVAGHTSRERTYVGGKKKKKKLSTTSAIAAFARTLTISGTTSSSAIFRHSIGDNFPSESEFKSFKKDGKVKYR